MQLRKNVFARTQDVGGEVDLDPRKVADILRAEAVRLGENQITDRLLVLQTCLPARDVVSTAVGQSGRHGCGKAEEADGFTMPVVSTLGLLAEVHNPTILEADFHRLIAWFNLAIRKEEVLARRPNQPVDHARVVQHITVQKEQRVSRAQPSGLRVKRYQAALTIARIVHKADSVVPAVSLHLFLDHFPLVADCNACFSDASCFQSVQMPLQERTSAEFEHHLRWMAIAPKAPPNAGGKDDCEGGLLILQRSALPTLAMS